MFFSLVPGVFFSSNTLEQFKFKLEKIILIQKPTEKTYKIDLIKKIDWLFHNRTVFLLKNKIIVLDNQLYKMMDAFVLRIT